MSTLISCADWQRWRWSRVIFRVFLLEKANNQLNIFWKAFEFIVGQGHTAVIIFFVLSGYLVGKHVYLAFNTGRWSWREYAIKRLSRLWIVLIPALILTAI